MTKNFQFTETEKKVVELLMQGKSNKDIARALSIKVTTVEFHIGNIFTKLDVHSRTEAMAQLGKSTGRQNPKDSRVVEKVETDYDNLETATTTEPASHRFQMSKYLSIAAVILIVIITYLVLNAKPWTYTREAEFPDEYTVGQDVDRSNASGRKVHGQFGSISQAPWTAQSGFVQYININIPKNSQLYLQIRYSKFSRASVPILVYLDDEKDPRASFYPQDQGDWNKFEFTKWIQLNEINKGMHSIKFSTAGEEFGVADLDKFILTTKPSPSRR